MNKVYFLSIIFAIGLAFGEALAQTTPTQDAMNNGSTAQSNTEASDTLDPVLDTTRSGTQSLDNTAETGNTGFNSPGMTGSATGGTGTGTTGFGTGGTGTTGLGTGGTGMTQNNSGSAETTPSDTVNPVLDTTGSDTTGGTGGIISGSTGTSGFGTGGTGLSGTRTPGFGAGGMGTSGTGTSGFGTGGTGSLGTGTTGFGTAGTSGTSGTGSGR
jgi:hypothetical protein